MKDISEIIKEEWEIAILAGVVVVLLLWGVLSLLDSGERVLSTPGLAIEEEERELLTEDALGFLKAHEKTEIHGNKPFELPEWAHAEFPKPAPKPKAAVAAPKAAPVVVAAAPAPEPEPVAPKAAPKPVATAPVPVVGKLFFSESQEMDDGTLVALMQLTRGDRETVLSLGKGESACGITVVNIDNKAVIVQDAKKRKSKVRRESEIKVWMVAED